MTRVLVIGAGPAGLAAAVAARDRGAEVVLVDASDAEGGQFWRHLPAQRAGRRESRLHHGWSRFTALRERLRADPGCEILLETGVWAIEPGERPVVHVLRGPADGGSRSRRALTADAVVIATGAYDRTLPFPGWQLPGVYSGGAAQALAKGERVAVGRRVVVAGAGPFLLPVAASLSGVGAEVAGVFEASGSRALAAGWLPRPWELTRVPGKAAELAGYAVGQLRRRIPYRVGWGVIEALGAARVEAITVARLDDDWWPRPGTERTLEVDAVCVSHGFTPRLELALAAGCALGADRFVAVDAAQATSVPGVYAAGELTGIGGADAALSEGAIAGHCAAGGHPDDRAVRRAVSARRTASRFAARLERAHAVHSGWTSWLSDDTIVCRCEEVTAGMLREVRAATPDAGLRSLRLTTRAGLGPCQGRMCGRAVEEVLGTSEASMDRRPIALPVRVGELADRETDET